MYCAGCGVGACREYRGVTRLVALAVKRRWASREVLPQRAELAVLGQTRAHSEMLWAFVDAKKAQRHALQPAMVSARAKPFRGRYSSRKAPCSGRPRITRAAHRRRELFSTAAGCPYRAQLRHQSCMRAMSGETRSPCGPTHVRATGSTATCRRGGINHVTRRRAQQAGDDPLLQGAEGIVAPVKAFQGA